MSGWSTWTLNYEFLKMDMNPWLSLKAHKKQFNMFVAVLERPGIFLIFILK